ncbi:MAG: ABC transporter ATP-binding protein [Candidatus Heimdallarchaeota archaeon]
MGLTISDTLDIMMEDVSFTYKGSDRPALKNINLTVKQGEIVMISGPAGAGKTTLCNTLNGLVPHFFRGKLSGKVVIQGLETKKHTIAYLSHRVGLLFQDPAAQLVAPTVEDEVAFGAENYGISREEIMARVKEAMKMVRIEKYATHSPHRLSGGEQQACALAAVAAMRPQIYVLDEPTSNLDPIGSFHVLELVTELARRENKTIIIVEHKMEELLPLIDRLIILNEGEIILEGPPRELLENVDRMDQIGLKPPQVTLLAERLQKAGAEISTWPITVEEAVETFSKIFSHKKREEITPLKEQIVEPQEEIIRAENLWHIYEDGTEALRGVNVKFYHGEFVGIIGQNGSGKTTLVKHFNGLLRPTKGRVIVDGIDTYDIPIPTLAKKVGYAFQNPDFQICKSTVQEELAFGPKNLKLPQEEIDKRAKEVADALGLKDVFDANPFSLSKGERQKVAVASILAMQPDVLIIDEPTTGQSPGVGRQMMEFYKHLNEAGKTIIVITHDMNLAAEYAQRIIVLKDGKLLLDGPTREVYAQTETLQTSFLRPPQITRFAQAMTQYGVLGDIISVDEMYEQVVDLVGGT